MYKQGFKTLTRALQYRNFRYFIAGQSISLIGTWMQRIALGWLVYRLTGSVYFHLKLPEIRKHAHPIYIRLGILPEIAGGLQSATEITAYDKNLD
jgi:hypothetical protein